MWHKNRLWGSIFSKNEIRNFPTGGGPTSDSCESNLKWRRTVVNTLRESVEMRSINKKNSFVCYIIQSIPFLNGPQREISKKRKKKKWFQFKNCVGLNFQGLLSLCLSVFSATVKMGYPLYNFFVLLAFKQREMNSILYNVYI